MHLRITSSKWNVTGISGVCAWDSNHDFTWNFLEITFTYFFLSLTSLFYLSPVGTRSSGFYLATHSNCTTFRERFIMLVILLQLFSSLTKPNMTTQIIWEHHTSLMQDPSRDLMSSRMSWGADVTNGKKNKRDITLLVENMCPFFLSQNYFRVQKYRSDPKI